jgi:hypothetical protein
MSSLLLPYIGELTDFEKAQYYFMGAFLSPFITVMAGSYARLFPMTYLFLLGSIVFFASTLRFTETGVEVWSYGFIIAGLMFAGVFVFLEILPKLAVRKLRILKQEGLLVKGRFIKTIFDYSIKLNGRPRQKAVVELIHPVTEKKVLLESRGSFDSHFLLETPETIDVYFDRLDPKVYIFDI